jgi:hypothetical protein
MSRFVIFFTPARSTAMRLDLESLRVESFGTEAAAVEAALPPTYDRSCILSCPIAC